MESAGFYPKKGRVILHIDMNAFYCSVHEASEPERYKGRPLAVAGDPERRKGVIVTSSYAARAKGVKTGMRVKDALSICPELIVIAPDFPLYRQFSRRFLAIAESYSPLVEPVSIDECYVDITGSKAFGTPLEIARAIQQRVLVELGLPCSVGIAPNKLLAKMASDMKKPAGISVLRLRDVPNVLWPLPCGELHGIGRRTAAKLAKLGIRTIGELAAADEAMLTKTFGTAGARMKRAANGRDDSPVVAVRRPSKSVGHMTTLPRDVTDRERIGRVLLGLSDRASRRMRKQSLLCSTVQITIRDPQMKTITRAGTLAAPTDHWQDIYRMACALFDKHWPADRPVRLLGVTLQNLLPKEHGAQQLDLFDYERQMKKARIVRALDEIRDKFGERSIGAASMLDDRF